MNSASLAVSRLLLPLALLGLAGCSQNLLVTVDGYADAASATVKPGAYELVSGDPRMPEDDLQFRANAAQVERALAASGWARVNAAKDAATTIRFRWFVSGPTAETRDYETPEYGVTGYHVARISRTDPATGQTTTRSSVSPAYGYTGTTRRTDTRITYGMGLILEAYAAPSKDTPGAPRQLWKIIVATRDTRGDFRRLLPEMLRVATPHLGTDTRGLREIEIKPPEAP